MDESDPRARHRRLLGDQLKLRHLRLLEMIARSGSLTAAARELHLTQPAVTNMLKDLEAALDARLVERDRRGGRLTPAGQLALERLTISLSHFDVAVETLHAQAPQLLRVAMLPLFGADLLPRAIARLHERGAALRLQIDEDTASGVIRRVADGRADCALGFLDERGIASTLERQFRVLPLFDEELKVVCAASNPLARKRGVDLPLLAGQAWVLAPRATTTRQAFDSIFIEAGIEPPVATVESASLRTNLSLVAATGLVTVAPASAIEAIETAGRLRSLRMAGTSRLGFRLALLSLAQTAAFPALKAFGEALSSVVAGRASKARAARAR